MKRISKITGGILLVLIIASCQQIFTYSPLEWAQRDPSKLPEAQKIAYAESVLSSGNTEEIVAAYNLISEIADANPNDVDLQLLAADLALGGSGIMDAFESVDVATLDSSTVESILSTIDLTLVEASADYVVAAEAIDPNAITPEQYLNTGLILLAKAADEAGDFSSLNTITSSDTGWDTLVQADTYITNGGGDISDYGVSNANL